MKTANVVTSISMILTLMIAILSLIGIVITGFYPGIVVLWLLALIPFASKFYIKKTIDKPGDLYGKHFTTVIVINLLCILVVLWMSFVIIHDRVLHDCC